MSLLEFIPAITPWYEAPRHLAPLCSLLERAPGGQLRLVVSAPPCHAMTETILAATAWWLSRDPSVSLIYFTRGAAIARAKLERAHAFASAAGVELRRAGAFERRTNRDGMLLAGGIGSALCGVGADVLVVDSPPAAVDGRTWEWFASEAITRLMPGGSLLIVQTRSSHDDLAGRAIRDLGFDHLRFPAIDERGAALWPERKDLAALARIRGMLGEDAWWSLYMQSPRPGAGESDLCSS